MAKSAGTRRDVMNSRGERKAATEAQVRRALQSLIEQGLEINISAVAVEAGYTPSLIHNSYPGLAEEIRAAAGRSLRAQLEKTKQQLVEMAARNAQLREENASLDADVTDLASENEALRRELIVQRAVATGKVSKLRS